jgi:hypothetical protein
MTAEPLKPLPCLFCGSDRVYSDWEPARHEFDECDPYVQCLGCGIRTEPHRYRIEREAISAWNRRAESIGNSDELWDWLARRIRNVTYGYQKAADGYYYRDGYHDALEWVLSLKKENK